MLIEKNNDLLDRVPAQASDRKLEWVSVIDGLRGNVVSLSRETFPSPWPMLSGAAFAVMASWLFFLLIERWSIPKPRIMAALQVPS